MKKTDIKKLCMGCMKEKPSASCVCPHCGFDEKEYSKSHSEALPLRTVLENKYIIGKQLGNGGFGKTYVAYDMNINRKMCIKEMFPMQFVRRSENKCVTALSGYEDEFADYIEKAHDEALRLSEFNELPGVVSVRDYFEDNGTAYIVMDFIEGKTLRDYLQENGDILPVEWVLEAMKPLLETLAQIHDENVIHRDISPDNIILSEDKKLVLIDFGAAREYSAETNNSFTSILKHGYAPIEQYARKGHQGPWTDIYALAATIYRMITGEVLPESTERAVTNQKPFNNLKTEYTPKITKAITKALSIDYTKRYQRIDKFYEAIYGISMPINMTSEDMYQKALHLCLDEQDDVNSFIWCKKAAENGNAKAMRSLGANYLLGYNVTKDYKKALKWYKMAAKKDNIFAMLDLGKMYMTGDGVVEDYKEALKWYKMAAKKDDATAMCHLCIMYRHGLGVPKDLKKASTWCQRAIEKDGADVMRRLAIMYEEGDGVPRNYAEAIKWYNKAADSGDSYALFRLGLMYRHGEYKFGINMDLDKAIEYYQKAAEKGDTYAMRELGLIYIIKDDIPSAVQYYQKAAELGDCDAMLELGNRYIVGQLGEQNIDMAIDWYKKAAIHYDRSSRDASSSAMVELGVIYENGIGVSPDFLAAAEWYKAAAERDKYNPYAMVHLGNTYRQGKGIRKDYKEAVRWYQKAAELSDGCAMYELGYIYENGIGVEADLDVAKKWYEKAAEHSNEWAMYELGYIYENGIGVEADLDVAKKWYEKAVEKYSECAMYALGLMYEKGKGVELNTDMAKKLYEDAAATMRNHADYYNYAHYRYTHHYYFCMISRPKILHGVCNAKECYKKMIEWYEKAAENGSTKAILELADTYSNGELVDQDIDKAVEWIDKATKGYEEGSLIFCDGRENARDKLSNICNNIGNIYHFGNDVYAQDYAKAFEWYKKAADYGNAQGKSNIGLYYENGWVVAQNYEEAACWYERAVRSSREYLPDVQDKLLYIYNSLGDRYYYANDGYSQDYGKAFEWYKKAADYGDADAMCEIGCMYDRGVGVEQDKYMAFAWFEASAEAGDSVAMLYVGLYYENGWGCEQDYKIAAKWYQKAIDAGYKYAEELLSKLQKKMKSMEKYNA